MFERFKPLVFRLIKGITSYHERFVSEIDSVMSNSSKGIINIQDPAGWEHVGTLRRGAISLLQPFGYNRKKKRIHVQPDIAIL